MSRRVYEACREYISRQLGRALVAPLAPVPRPQSEAEWEARERRALWNLIQMHEGQFAAARAAAPDQVVVRTTSGSGEFAAALAELEAAGERLISLSRGPGNAEWVLRSLPRRLVQGHLFHSGRQPRP